MTDLNALIERLSRATGPLRELDVLIFGSVVDLVDGEPWSADDLEYAASAPERTCNAPRYTSSIDAAMTLVPPLDDMLRPLKITLGVSESGKKFECHFDNWKWGTIKSRPCAGYAIAIAICALKSRSPQP